MAAWVVLKFGGTSVSTAARWATIASESEARIAAGERPLVVCSALSGVSNLLEALGRRPSDQHDRVIAEVERRHRELARDLGVADDAWAGELAELKRLAMGAALIGEASPRLQARILAMGELLATRLGAAWLGDRGGWVDARSLLVSLDDPTLPEARRVLSAECRFDPDPALEASLAARSEPILVTQGFIARDAEGGTVLLGRGGSDTSAAYFAARLGAVRCEIWTDVPGMYTTNPRAVPDARLLRRLGYDEAMEIAAMGAKVLHPRCIPPVRAHGIPMQIRCTERPDAEGTTIALDAASGPGVKSVAARTQITVISMETVGMWQQVGFLARVFRAYEQRGLSIDLVSTSQSNVTVSLDPTANALSPAVLQGLVEELSTFCSVRVIGPCAAVALVGQGIRSLLPELGGALRAFEERRIHLVSQAASDLNLTFVVDEPDADRLVQTLHGALFAETRDPMFGPPLGGARPPEAAVLPWWREKRAELLALAQHTPCYVYDRDSLRAAAAEVRALGADRALYAMKANPNPDILRLFAAEGLGFECVSPGELARLRESVPDISLDRVLFTPNFAPRADYALAIAAGVQVTLDNLYPLSAWGELFAGARIFLRIDPGRGHGHHQHVKTAGVQSKFGIHPTEIAEARRLCAQVGARVVGLHAHVGSGVRDASVWAETAGFLASVAESFPEVTVLDVGGGLGVVEKSGQTPLDLSALAASLRRFREADPRFALWIEPGRYLVARAGVLLARVTQQKSKGDMGYVGIDAGMNSLIRPALYGAWHEIVNLTRLEAPRDRLADVVGPICESGDVLGRGRYLPETHEGDVLLIGTAGAYGAAMSSSYNLRAPAVERLI
jgi:diaminopimelate decarboxylase/aspartate kinase